MGITRTFLDLYLHFRFDLPTLATQSSESQSTLRTMLSYQPVPKHIAQKILTHLSTTLQKDLTLENCDIPLFPTFAEVFSRHNTILISELAKKASVLPDIVTRMLEERPVLEELANNVLVALSELTYETYTLSTVDVNIYVIVEHKSEVAELMRNIDAQYTSAQSALIGPTLGIAQHGFMTKRLELIATYSNQLYDLVGTETASQLLQQFGD